MPCVDDLIEWLGTAHFILMLDLKKGYWQVSLTPSSQPKTALSTTQYWVLPFGLHGASATLQHLMEILLWPHWPYVTAYLDDVFIHSYT